MTTPAAPSYLLDTSIVIPTIRMGELGRYLEATFSLSTVQPPPIISVITEGETRAFMLKRGWGPGRVSAVNVLLGRLVILPIPYVGLVDAYARIDAHCEKNGLALGKNDLWIAATAHITGATLMTSDGDFDPLEGVFLRRLWVDPSSRL